MEIEENKKEFEEVFTENITREGSAELLAWLKKSDFFEAPASSKFHSAHPGGLCEHSLNCYRRFLSAVQREWGEEWEKKISRESVAICGLLHDVCKVNYYKQEMRNVKVNGVWEQQPYFTVKDTLPYGHGEKSVYILSGFMRLSREEAMAINWHMGGFDMRVKGGSYSISEAFYDYPVAFMFHIADMEATYLDEKK